MFKHRLIKWLGALALLTTWGAALFSCAPAGASAPIITPTGIRPATRVPTGAAAVPRTPQVAWCRSFSGYGRYTLHVGCEQVAIAGQTYSLTRRDNEFVIEGHTISRGIYRKTRPWLYVHNMEGDSVDVTLDEGSKPEYPLYTGASDSIFDVYAGPWPMTRSTNAAFSDNYWLISHRWSDTGILFDLQQQQGSVTNWSLVRGDIFVPGDGTEVTIGEIHTKVKILTFEAGGQRAQVQFTAMP